MAAGVDWRSLLARLAPWHGVTVSVSELLHTELFRALTDAAQPDVAALTKDAATGQVAQPAAYWQWHTESYLAKAPLDTGYLGAWHAAAADFYAQAPWAALPDTLTVDVAVNGVGRSTVVLTGADGSAPTLHVFRAARAVDFAEAHWRVVFTARDHAPFVDQDLVDMYGFALAPGPGTRPVVVKDLTTFKRPPRVDLEMMRACFVVLPRLLAHLANGGAAANGGGARVLAVAAEDPSTWAEARFPLEVEGECHPTQVTVTVPGTHQREAALAPAAAAAFQAHQAAQAAARTSGVAASLAALGALAAPAPTTAGATSVVTAVDAAWDALVATRGCVAALTAHPALAADLAAAVAGNVLAGATTDEVAVIAAADAAAAPAAAFPTVAVAHA